MKFNYQCIGWRHAERAGVRSQHHALLQEQLHSALQALQYQVPKLITAVTTIKL